MTGFCHADPLKATDHFYKYELACRCCGEVYWAWPLVHAIEEARVRLGKAIYLNSAHRCKRHNKAVGGVKYSRHLKLAFDVSLKGHDRFEVLKVLKESGFTSFGLYKTFIHVDMDGTRFWCQKVNRKYWNDSRLKVILPSARLF